MQTKTMPNQWLTAWQDDQPTQEQLVRGVTEIPEVVRADSFAVSGSY